MPLLDGRPPAIDTRFRPGNTFTVTFNWPEGSLAGRTFTADLDATALDLTVLGDVMTVAMTEAETLAAASVGEFVLTETTGGASDVTIIGSWHSSNGPSAGEATTVSVNESSGVVNVSPSGFPGIVGDLAVSGELTVPNPAPPGVANAAVSIGEVQDLIAAEPSPGARLDVAGGLVNVGPEVPTMMDMGANSLQTVNNTTTQTDLTVGDAVVAAGVLSIADWCATVTAGGFVMNSSGGADTTTIRLRCHDGTTDHIVAEWAMPLANDTSVARVWSLTATVRMVDFVGLRPCTIGSWMLDAGNSNPFLVHGSVVTAAVLDAASTATTWRITAQHSVAHADTRAACTAAALTYAGPAVA